MSETFSCQMVFKDSVQLRFVVVLRGCLLHLQQGFAAPDLEAGDVVVEPGRFVYEMPADVWFLDARHPGARLPRSDQPRRMARRMGRPGGFRKGELVDW